ncbi:MAG TPA: sulfite exporter TauE/SafE family protein [Ktedonobacterales bacterium]|nr:sulfite exporter TauE/SafE family protein [Ktedonobacterales bacterium]
MVDLLSGLNEHQAMFFALVFAASLLAGLVGALVGLGGGVFIVPILTLVFGLPFPVAAGASIVSVIATSSGAAAAYVRDHITNLRVGMFLEIATTLGALCGAILVSFLPVGILFLVFGAVLLASGLSLIAKHAEELPVGVRNDRLAVALALAGTYPDEQLGREVHYQVARTPLGFAMMYLAGLISGLLGIGSGVFKVLALDTAMRLPMKVSTTTSNFMIGVTAAASVGIYLARGQIDPLVAAPVALGVVLGATIGARTLARLSNTTIRRIFVVALLLAAFEMFLHGLGVNL